ncbi:MAG TPA: aminoglycoside phosphotransferase family protein [Streptosporangiaceae bacterium]|nr:aminoglycoside phosphotransferase family protein [Streptosporangiaceae bacterium]
MDKAAITADLVSRLIAAQFPQWAGLPVRPVELDGWDNTTFRLGEDMSVRLPSGDKYVLQVDKEHRWLPVLAPRLPLPIPQPLAKGAPGCGFVRPWSVYRWLDGDTATAERVTDQVAFAADLAGFLTALYRIDVRGGPPPGDHNFFRGGPLTVYDGETRAAIAALGSEVDAGCATRAWEAALRATWRGTPVWVHGDIASGNLLVRGGRLHAVIDFGCSGVGDPAGDTAIAWTFLSGEARRVFRSLLPFDEATWARGRGWALWKALIVLVDALDNDPQDAILTKRVIDEVLAEHEACGAL